MGRRGGRSALAGLGAAALALALAPATARADGELAGMAVIA